MAYKQFGYRSGLSYDRSYCIEERGLKYIVTIDFIPRHGRRISGTPMRTVVEEFYGLKLAQAFVEKKV